MIKEYIFYFILQGYIRNMYYLGGYRIKLYNIYNTNSIRVYIRDKKIHILGIKSCETRPSKMFVVKLQTFFGDNIKFLMLGIAFCV